MGFLSETFFESAFDGRCSFMGFIERQMAVHAYVHLDGDAVADAASV